MLEQIRQKQKSEAWKMTICFCFCAEMSWKQTLGTEKFGTYHKRDEALEFTEKINGDRSMAVTWQDIIQQVNRISLTFTINTCVCVMICVLHEFNKSEDDFKKRVKSP